MVLLLLVKVTLLPVNLASLNWRHMSSLSFMLAWHLSWDARPGAAAQVSVVAVWVLVHRVQANRIVRQHAACFVTIALSLFRLDVRNLQSLGDIERRSDDRRSVAKRNREGWKHRSRKGLKALSLPVMASQNRASWLSSFAR